MSRQHELLLAEIREPITINATYSITDDQKEMMRQMLDGYYYWPHSGVQLVALFQLLVNAGLVQSQSEFDYLFKNQNSNGSLKIKWLGDQTQLMYLFYLIYGGKPMFKNEPLFRIALKLFCDEKGSDFSAKNLSTTYSVVQSKINGKNLTKKLIVISDLHSELMQVN